MESLGELRFLGEKEKDEVNKLEFFRGKTGSQFEP